MCLICVGYFYHLRCLPSSQALAKNPITWEPHKNSECMCAKDSRGRPSKKRKPVDVEDGSDTESGEDDDGEAENDFCNMFCNISENLHHLDKELALVLLKNICSQFGKIFIDPDNMHSSMRAIDRQLVLKMVEVILRLFWKCQDFQVYWHISRHELVQCQFKNSRCIYCYCFIYILHTVLNKQPDQLPRK